MATKRVKRATKKAASGTRKQGKRTAKAASGSRGGGYSADWSVARSPDQDVKSRTRALSNLSIAVSENDTVFDGVLTLLKDTGTPAEVRMAALLTLQAGRFSVLLFQHRRPKYLSTLRGLIEDEDLVLRRRVLGILAREKDGMAQSRLLEGLQDPGRALVAPEKALQLLSYDIHSEAYPLARDIVQNPPNPEAKREALRLLAADAESAPVFEQILLDYVSCSPFRVPVARLEAGRASVLSTSEAVSDSR